MLALLMEESREVWRLLVLPYEPSASLRVVALPGKIIDPHSSPSTAVEVPDVFEELGVGVFQLQTAANKRCPRESIEIATLCRVASAELRTMPQLQSHAKSRSLRNATKSALSANRGWSALTSQGSADMAADAALKGKDNGIKKS